MVRQYLRRHARARGANGGALTAAVFAAIVFVGMFGGALVGMALRGRLPDHHLAKDTEDAVKLGLGVIATMTALVVGLLLASAKTTRDATERELTLFSADLVLLDRNLAQYGPETDAAEIFCGATPCSRSRRSRPSPLPAARRIRRVGDSSKTRRSDCGRSRRPRPRSAPFSRERCRSAASWRRRGGC